MAKRWIIVVAVLLLILAWLMVGRGPKVEDGTVLVIDLEGAYVEAHATPFSPALRPAAAAADRPALRARQGGARRAARRRWCCGSAPRDRLGQGRTSCGAAIARSCASAVGARVAYLEVERYGAEPRVLRRDRRPTRSTSLPDRAHALRRARGRVPLPRRLFEKLGVERRVREGRQVQERRGDASPRTPDVATRTGRWSDAILDSIYGQFVEAHRRAAFPHARLQVRGAIDAGPIDSAEELQRARAQSTGSAFFDEIARRLATASRSDRSMEGARRTRAVDPASVGFDPVASFALIYGTGPW